MPGYIVVIARIPIVSAGETRDDYHLSDERIAYHIQQQQAQTTHTKSARRQHGHTPLQSPGTGNISGPQTGGAAPHAGTSNHSFAHSLVSPTNHHMDSISSPTTTTTTTSSTLTKGALIYSMSITRQHIVIGTDDGTLLWISRSTDQLMYLQHMEQSMGNGICCLIFSPSFTSFITLTVRGHMRLLRLVGDMIHTTSSSSSSRHGNVSEEPIFQTVTIGYFPVAVTLRSRKPVKYGIAVVPMPPTGMSIVS